MNQLLTLLLLSVFLTSTSYANVQVSFREGAPKDRFIIKNIGACALSDLTIEIDLRNSAGKLYFDTTATGAGVEVFQPFESQSEKLTLTAASSVADGEKRLLLNLQNLSKDETVSFTIDVDDAMVNSNLGQIRVSGGELVGAQVKLRTAANEEIVALFSDKNTATAILQKCD